MKEISDTTYNQWISIDLTMTSHDLNQRKLSSLIKSLIKLITKTVSKLPITDPLCRESAGDQSWRRNQMETFSPLLALCVGNSPVTGEFPAQRPVTRSFDVYFDLRLNKRLSRQSWGWWFEILSRSLWHHCNDYFHHKGSVIRSMFPCHGVITSHLSSAGSDLALFNHHATRTLRPVIEVTSQ